MLGTAVPTVVLLKEQNIFRSAARAFNAFRPTALDQILPAIDRIVEVSDCILESFEFHGSILNPLVYFAKYIIASVND
jgi:hypothetical protein